MARTCPECGGRVAVNAGFCSKCGSNLNGPSSSPPEVVSAVPPPPHIAQATASTPFTQEAAPPPPPASIATAPPPPPQHAPYAYPAPPQHIIVQQKKSHGCLIAFLVVLGLFIVIVIAAAIGASNSKKATTDANEKTCAAVTYPDHQPGDQCADANSQVNLEGYTVTAANFRREAEATFGPQICADVTYLNRADGASNYNLFDWKLQTPAGVVQSFELTDADLGSGQIVSGGTKTGSVCFEDNGETGQFVLIWKGEAFRADRGIWVVQL